MRIETRVTAREKAKEYKKEGRPTRWFLRFGDGDLDFDCSTTISEFANQIEPDGVYDVTLDVRESTRSYYFELVGLKKVGRLVLQKM